MFDKEKVQKFIEKYLNTAIQRYNIIDPHNIESRKYLEIKSHLWHDMEMANLVPYHTGNPEKRKPGTEKIYMTVEQMIDRAFRSLGSQQIYGESVKKIVNKFARIIEEKELTNEILEFLQVTRKHGLDTAISLDELEEELTINPDAGEIIDELYKVPDVKNIINSIMNNTYMMMEKTIQMHHSRGEDIDYIIENLTYEYYASPFNLAIQNIWGHLYDAIK